MRVSSPPTPDSDKAPASGATTRRQALVAGAALGTGAAVAVSATVRGGAREGGGEPRAGDDHGARLPERQGRMPVVFVPHGGGPWPFVETGIGSKDEQAAMAAHLRSVADAPSQRPRAILVISAHWEEEVPTVTTSPSPPLLYDYYGFPPASYEITWPAPGEPTVAARVRALLDAAGFATAADARRGFDHGTFVPLKLAYPAADIPTVQLSLKRGLDPALHLAMGRALAPLRDEGVFIIGSGMTYHNLRAFGPAAAPAAAAFDAWLRESATLPAPARAQRLTAWTEAPSAREAHPREEHLLPLMVVAGAAGADRATIPYRGTIFRLPLSAYHFGV